MPPQRELADLLGVSRVSVREGLKPLIDAGYIEVRRGSAGGAFVTELSQPIEAWRRKLRSQMDELDDLVDFRIAVESRVAYLAALRSTRANLAEMRTAMRVMRVISTDDAHSHRAFRRADEEFHGALGRAARNDRLAHAVRDARSEMFLPFDMLSFDEPRGVVQSDHQAVYEAVRDGQSVLAAERMTGHIQRAREQLRSFVTGGPPQH